MQQYSEDDEADAKNKKKNSQRTFFNWTWTLFFFFPKHFNDSQSTVVKKSIPPNTPFSLSDSKCKQPGFSKATGQATSTYKLGLSNTDTQQNLFLFMSCMSFLSHMSKLPKLFEQFQANTWHYQLQTQQQCHPDVLHHRTGNTSQLKLFSTSISGQRAQP